MSSALDFIAEIRDPRIRDLFRLAFAATMVSCSNYSYEPSLGRRTADGRPELADFPVDDAIADRLRKMADDIRWLRARRVRPRPKSQVMEDSFFEAFRQVARESVDLIVTSPPYLNNYHYNRNTRPQLYWLDFVQSAQDLKRIENLNFGKYWQTVRQGPVVRLDPRITDPEINAALDLLRSRRPEKGV